MEYLIGLAAALVVAAIGRLAGFDRDRAFYPTVLIVIATYYILFAALGAPRQTMVIEIAVALGFSALAVVGFKKTAWVVAAGLIGHGLFDFVRPAFINNPGVPMWWPGFCLAADFPLGVFLAVLLVRHPEQQGRTLERAAATRAGQRV